MEILIRNFVNYLFDFVNFMLNQGLINVNSVKDFLSIYDRFQGNNVKLQDLLPTLLFEYFVNLDKENLDKICKEVSSKFIQKNKFEKEKSLNQIAKIHNKIIHKNKQEYFYLFQNRIRENSMKYYTTKYQKVDLTFFN